MIEKPNRRSQNFVFLLRSRSGFSMIEALVTIALVAMVVLANLLMMGSIFNTRKYDNDHHKFDENLERVVTQLDNFEACESVFASLGPHFKVETLPSNPTIPGITIPSITIPTQSLSIVPNVPLPYKETLVFTDMKLRLAHEYKLDVGLLDQYPPVAYTWLELNYEYRKKVNAVDTVIASGTRQVMYEVAVTSKDAAGLGGGEYVTGACADFIKKKTQMTMKLMCFVLGMKPLLDGKCDLKNSEVVRETACHMTGYHSSGRYCDTSNPY